MDQRVHVDRKAVTHPANLDVLVERVVVAVLSQQPDVALAVRHLVFASGVVGHISVADVFDVPDHAVEDVGHSHIGLVVHGDDSSARAVLPHVVRDLTNVLGQLVDGQARTGVDGLPLHSTTGSQHIGGPLPLVVGGACVKAQIVCLVFP